MNPEPAVVIERIDDARWLTAADTCLSPSESARSRRFRRPPDRDTWRAGRAWVRHQLAQALDRPPASLAFTTTPNGRPHVVDAPPGFDCNWSHSGPWMALAMSHHHPVGIDIEVIRPDFSHRDVAATVCTPHELAALAAAPDEPARNRHFLRLWTAKEALMKATGLGVALDPAEIDIRLRHDQPPQYASHPDWHLEIRESGGWVAAWTWCRKGATPLDADFLA